MLLSSPDFSWINLFLEFYLFIYGFLTILFCIIVYNSACPMYYQISLISQSLLRVNTILLQVMFKKFAIKWIHLHHHHPRPAVSYATVTIYMMCLSILLIPQYISNFCFKLIILLKKLAEKCLYIYLHIYHSSVLLILPEDYKCQLFYLVLSA